ncbi:hypothetical protein [Modestobacter sp. I12A-02662]|uniref:hypothetical protein n=1 Tax=Modestobacter sp. I12A-02662 TaxID=1730496 RepID=UPI0034DFCCFF
MSAPCSPTPAGAFSRRALLLAAAAGSAALAAGCTNGAAEDPADAVTPAQADRLAAQVEVQERLVADYAQALAASPQLAASAAVLAAQSREQLDRLRAAAAQPAPSSGATAGTSAAEAVPAEGAVAWLQARVAAAADAHARACPDFTGGRAALLGSIAAGLRAQAGQLS